MNNQASNNFRNEHSNNSITPFFPYQNTFRHDDEGDEWNPKELLDLLRRRALVIIGVSTTVMLGVAINLILNPKPVKYESSFQMLVEPENHSNQVADILEDFNPLSNKSALDTLDYESQILVLKSPELVNKSINKLKDFYPEIDYEYLMNGLAIVRLGETKILEIRYRSEDPLESKAVLEQIARDYLQYSLEKRQTRINLGLQYIDREIPVLQGRVDQIQKEFQLFQQRYNFITPELISQQVDGRTATLVERQQELGRQIAQARVNLDFVQSEEGTRTVLESYPVYQELNNELRQLNLEIAKTSTLLQDDNPRMITLRERRDKLVPIIQEESERYILTKRAEAVSALRSLQVNMEELQKSQQILALQHQQLPDLLRQYTEIQRKLKIATESLIRFLSTRESLQIQNSQAEIGWQLIQLPDLPEKPVVSSTLIRDIILGAAGSIFLGIAAASLVEKLDHTYHNAWNLKERVKLPLLGNIPFKKELTTLKPEDEPEDEMFVLSDPSPKTTTQTATIRKPRYYGYSTNFLEAIRVLYTNIQLLNSDSQIRSISVTSAMPGDGKSTIAFYLAEIATAMGKRVLLVDADMRRASIHNLSKLDNLWGLSSLITSNLPVEQVVKELPSMKGLSIITAGPTPPDCAKLLSSAKMKRLMADLYKEFDLVIYDLPPVVGLADASLIAPETDGLLLIARIEKTDRSVFERALADLKQAPINILGVVANGQKGNVTDYYYYTSN
ncbi:GumC family protein [Umezakia ovalisporum]|uniref:GumC family protein n=1 Tax=Umezakia ovalisporum TaxID=75695 RepID=UPI002473C795|nr:polysaccharide biosynthesis tyrosine autokinase [Umezakia ovalisporum]MDH6083786.1 polysaccharide biosynthesis tyrosine autokinase [Umezakia ovalisporum TAC611]